MASCNKCSVKRHDSHCHCMPLLASDPRPARLSRRPGNSGPTAQRHAGRGVWGCLPMRGGTPGGPADAASWGRGCWCPLGPEISRWAWAAAAGGRPGIGTLQARDQTGCVLEAVGGGGVALGFSPAALWEEVNKRKYLWREWGHDQGVGSGAVLLLPPEAPRPCTYPFGEGSLQTASFLSPLLVSPHGYMESLPLLLKDMRVVGSRRGLRSWYWTREL